jgi:hypothetical protein
MPGRQSMFRIWTVLEYFFEKKIKNYLSERFALGLMHEVIVLEVMEFKIA